MGARMLHGTDREGARAAKEPFPSPMRGVGKGVRAVVITGITFLQTCRQPECLT